MGLFTRIRGLVATRPVPLWESGRIPIQSDVAAGDVIFDAGDAIGPVGQVVVPVAGTLEFARLYDRADLGTQLNVVLFYKNPILPPASDAQFALNDADLLEVLYPLEFIVAKDYINGQAFFLDHLGVPYKLAPHGAGKKWGIMYFQAYAPAAQTHVIGSEPQFSISIYPDYPV